MTRKFLLALITYCLLFSAFLTISPAVNAQSKKDLRAAKKFTENGDKALNERNYQLAIQNYAQAIVLAPNLPEPHFWKGYAHYYQKEYDQALAEINMAEDLNFNKPLEIYKIRWFLNYEKKNYDEAYEDVQKGLQAEPANINFIVASGDIYRAKNDCQNALSAYKKAIQVLKTSGGDLYYFMAACHFNLNQTNEQGVAAAQAIQKGTKYIGESYLLIGDAFQKERKFDEALNAYQQALNIKEDNYEVYRSMAEIYRGQTRYDDAIGISRKALRLYPNDGNIYTDLSWYYSLANRHEEAIQAAQAGIRFLPNESLAYTNLCRAYNDTKQYQLAINSCNKALTISPNDGETNFYLGYAHQLMGKTADAPKYYKKAVAGLVEYTQQNPQYSDGFYLLGNAYFSDNQPLKAIEAYQKCLELSPRFSRARYNLGMIYVSREEKPQAQEQYRALLELDKDLAAKLKAAIDE